MLLCVCSWKKTLIICGCLRIRLWVGCLSDFSNGLQCSHLRQNLLLLQRSDLDKEALFEIAKLLGKPRKIDGYTANKSKLNQANILVEIDVSKPLPGHLWINVAGVGTAVRLFYNKILA